MHLLSSVALIRSTIPETGRDRSARWSTAAAFERNDRHAARMRASSPRAGQDVSYQGFRCNATRASPRLWGPVYRGRPQAAL